MSFVTSQYVKCPESYRQGQFGHRRVTGPLRYGIVSAVA